MAFIWILDVPTYVTLAGFVTSHQFKVHRLNMITVWCQNFLTGELLFKWQLFYVVLGMLFQSVIYNNQKEY